MAAHASTRTGRYEGTPRQGNISFDIVIRKGHELTKSDVDVYGFAAGPLGEIRVESTKSLVMVPFTDLTSTRSINQRIQHRRFKTGWDSIGEQRENYDVQRIESGHVG